VNPVHRIGGYREYAPPPGAAAFCEAIWIHETPPDAVGGEGSAHRVLPDMGVSVAYQAVRDEDGRPVHGAPVLIGAKRRAQIFNLVPGRELAAVRVKPEWTGPLLGVDPLDFEDRVVDLREACPALAAGLDEALERTRTPESAVRILLSVTLAAHADAPAPASRAAAALDVVRRTAGRVPCDRVAAAVGWSDRHLRRHVHDAVGISPKSYARVLRFVQSMLMADAFERPAWADVAVGAGYCDQSHLIRDAVAMTGRTPRELHAERRRQRLDAAAMSDSSNPL
jgi:AraC-like DNA-binding protein